MKKRIILPIFLFYFFIFGCSHSKKTMALETSKMKITFNNKLYSRISIPGAIIMDGFQPADYVVTNFGTVSDFTWISSRTKQFKDSIGTGRQLSVTGISKRPEAKLQKTVVIKAYKDFPSMLVKQIFYKNKGKKVVGLKLWGNNKYNLTPSDTDSMFWSFQSGSYEDRPDWVRPVKKGFHQENYLGMNASDYGGGTPVVDIWRRDAGLAVGHLSLHPELVSLPVAYDSVNNSASLKIIQKVNVHLGPGQAFSTLPTFISVHHGDYFATLQNYSRFMQKKGIRFDPFPDNAYQPVWCAWGYERGFTPRQILETLPKVKKLGFKWVVLDDGWQTAIGDWALNPDKFPHGDADMRALVDQIHAKGLKAKLWWAPLAVAPGSRLYRQHPELLLINSKGTTQDISWWDSYYLCPSFQPVIAYTDSLVRKFLLDWGFDGLKIDGQYLNAVPPCYNPKHNHKSPLDAVHALPAFFKSISSTARKFKPDAVVEICPCGTSCSFFNMPYLNQPVASDPTSSWQVRLKGKTYKALMGGNVPYYGDHVELSDGQDDFASAIGVGGVPGSKFTVGAYINHESGDVRLTKQKEKIWQKWLEIYNTYQLSKGEYLGGLYDIGFDRPETHVIRKNGKWFYAFYAKKFNGLLTLRGLPAHARYKVTDYEHGKYIGKVDGGSPKIKTKFNGHLLIKVEKL